MFNARTCTLLAVNKETCRVDTLTMGDSEYVIYRNTSKGLEEVFHSESMQYEFNFPYQVGTGGDDPLKAHCESHILYVGDIIVMATDGLWDNLEGDDVKGMTERFLKGEVDGGRLHELAVMLVKEAHKKSLSK